MNLDKFIKEKIAIRFDSENEMIEFLKECDKKGLNWSSGSRPTIFVPTSECISFSKNTNGLCCGGEETYLDTHSIIDYKDFKKENYNSTNFEEIKRIVVNKNATIVFWNDDTKTIVKRNRNQQNNHELAILYAYFIKHSNLSKTSAKKVIQALVNNIYVQKNLKK